MPIIDVTDLDKQLNIDQLPSSWLQLDQERINLFADATLDHQFIHVDIEKAKLTPFGGTIAHGFLSLSALPYLSEQGGGITLKDAKMGVNYGFDKVRFIAPVKSGSRVRGHFRLVGATEKKPGQFLLSTEVTVEIEGEDKPALKALWLTMFYM